MNHPKDHSLFGLGLPGECNDMMYGMVRSVILCDVI